MKKALPTVSRSVSHAKSACCSTEEADDVLTFTNIMEEEYERFDLSLTSFLSCDKWTSQVQQESTAGWWKCWTVYHHIISPGRNMQLLEYEIRDRLMVGIWDQCLSQQLQMDPNLTLKQAKTRKGSCQTAAKDVRGQNRSSAAVMWKISIYY